MTDTNLSELTDLALVFLYDSVKDDDLRLAKQIEEEWASRDRGYK